MQPYKQPTATPTPKVTAVAISGLVVTAIALAGSALGITLPPSLTDNVGALVTGVTALVSIIHFLAGYFTHDTMPVDNPSQIIMPVTPGTSTLTVPDPSTPPVDNSVTPVGQ